MGPTSVDVKDMLEAESSLGLTFATDLFVGKEPDLPDNCITIFDTPGSPPDLNYDSDNKYFHPSVQIRIRNNHYLNGWNLAQDIVDLLHNRAHETWNGSNYTVIACLGDPMLLDWDQSGRCRFVVNFDFQRQPS